MGLDRVSALAWSSELCHARNSSGIAKSSRWDRLCERSAAIADAFFQNWAAVWHGHGVRFLYLKLKLRPVPMQG